MRYLLFATLATALFMAVYWLLRRDRWLQLSRWFLLGTLALSLVLPAFRFTVPVSVAEGLGMGGFGRVPRLGAQSERAYLRAAFFERASPVRLLLPPRRRFAVRGDARVVLFRGDVRRRAFPVHEALRAFHRVRTEPHALVEQLSRRGADDESGVPGV